MTRVLVDESVLSSGVAGRLTVDGAGVTLPSGAAGQRLHAQLQANVKAPAFPAEFEACAVFRLSLREDDSRPGRATQPVVLCEPAQLQVSLADWIGDRDSSSCEILQFASRPGRWLNAYATIDPDSLTATVAV